MIIAMLLNTINPLMLQIIISIQKEIEHTRNITSNITKHNHNNCEHNVTKTGNKHIKHILTTSTMIFLILEKPKTVHYRNKQIP